MPLARYNDPTAATTPFAEPRSKQHLRCAPTSVSRLARSLVGGDTASPRPPIGSTAATATRAGFLAGAPKRADAEIQERLIREHRAERHRLWVARQEPPVLSLANRKHALHLLMEEAERYHTERCSPALNKKLAASISQKHPGGVPASLRVDPEGSSLPKPVLQQIFADLDFLVDHYGRETGARALEQMFLWDTENRRGTQATQAAAADAAVNRK